ncbi:MAG: 3-hydroxyacyl-CoA dehydrogenase family protein [Clostridia bacterium]|nr:3-hydroxyacyl-CoA dehydrogenase family protein [Clostridia bacterium]
MLPVESPGVPRWPTGGDHVTETEPRSSQAESVRLLGVLGAGTMGAAIAHTAALHGIPAVCVDVSEDILDRARRRIDGLMKGRIERGKFTEEERQAVWERLSFTTDRDRLAGADFVIEAIIEDLAAKKAAFADLDRICREGVVLATNSSSMSITEIATATKRRDRVVGMHFFNPPQVMKLVEVVRGLETSDATVAEAKALAERMGRVPVEVRKDTPGYIVNRILMPQFIEALRLVEEGVATPEEIDKAVTLGLNYPMGPFTLMDFTGNDVNHHVLEYFRQESGDPYYTPPHLLKSMVRAGRLGRKTGRGFYEYGDESRGG